MAPRCLLWAPSPSSFLTAVTHPFRLSQDSSLLFCPHMAPVIFCQCDQELLGQALSQLPKPHRLRRGGDMSLSVLCSAVHQAPQTRPTDHGGRSEGGERGAVNITR